MTPHQPLALAAVAVASFSVWASAGCASSASTPETTGSTIVYEMAPVSQQPTARESDSSAVSATPAAIDGELSITTIERNGDDDKLEPRFRAALEQVRGSVAQACRRRRCARSW